MEHSTKDVGLKPAKDKKSNWKYELGYLYLLVFIIITLMIIIYMLYGNRTIDYYKYSSEPFIYVFILLIPSIIPILIIFTIYKTYQIVKKGLAKNEN